MKAKVSRLSYVLWVFLLMGGWVTAVSAHDAVITKSSPANGEVLSESPDQVVAWFTEELISGESTMKVFDAQGKQRDNGDGGVDLTDPDHASMIVTLPPLPDGSYTVQWHAVLVDGDASDGAFAFAVGDSQPVVQPAATASSSGVPIGWLAVILGVTAVILAVAGYFWRRPSKSSM
ncbi:MAG: copper resistance protein CopC [Anaerolineales bacterium]|nr:copper resistance protein CopC [Anaerolineales bacterium]